MKLREEKAYLFHLSLLCLPLWEVRVTAQELEAQTMGEDAIHWNECTCLASFPIQLRMTCQGNGSAHSGPGILYQLTAKTIPTNIFIGCCELGNPSVWDALLR